MFTLAKYSVLFAAVLVLAAMVLETSSNFNNLGVLEFIFYRVTVLQGDVSWWVWGLYNSGQQFPLYSQTLLAAFGDRVLVLFGLDQGDHYNWMLHHYDWMINYVAGVSLQRTSEGHSIVGTPFSEGLIIGGLAGVYFVALLAGALIAILYTSIKRSINQGRFVFAAILATYFYFYFFNWLVSGGISQLFHISIFVGFVVAIGIAKLLLLPWHHQSSSASSRI